MECSLATKKKKVERGGVGHGGGGGGGRGTTPIPNKQEGCLLQN